MRFTREHSGSIAIRAVDNGAIRIGETTYDVPVALTGDKVLGAWKPIPVAELAADHFGEILALGPEVIVLGTGASSQFAPRELVFALARRSVGFEVMNSAAAARTFNVLAGEGRKVAAVLYPP